jgi:hypothetical protein
VDTLVIEKNNRHFFVAPAGVVDHASFDGEHDWADATDKSNPFLKWISGDFVEADNPNSNTQFWTKDDLALGEYTIKFSPLNMLHKQRTPVGFFLSTRTVDLSADKAAQGTAKIEALSGMWTHIFPFESTVVDQAHDQGNLFYSMECRGTHLHCAGPNGCDGSFDYMAADSHCEHLRDRSSIRHIVNPTFRGGALIIPPTRPGWKDAHARVLREAALREEASLYAEQTESAFLQANAEGRDLTPSAWEELMAQVLRLAQS